VPRLSRWVNLIKYSWHERLSCHSNSYHAMSPHLQQRIKKLCFVLPFPITTFLYTIPPLLCTKMLEPNLHNNSIYTLYSLENILTHFFFFDNSFLSQLKILHIMCSSMKITGLTLCFHCTQYKLTLWNKL